MRKLLAIAWNDLKIEFSERSTLVFFLILPLIFTVIVGQGLGGSGDDGEENVYPIVVVDEDRSPLSIRLVDGLDAAGSLGVTPVTAAGLDAALADDDVLAVLTLPAGFGAGLQAGEPVEVGLERTSSSLSALAAAQEIQNGLAQIDAAVAAAQAGVAEAALIEPFAGLQAEAVYFEDRLAAALEAMRQSPPAQVQVTHSTQAAEATREIAGGFAQASPGQLVTWTLITLFGASEVFVGERLHGTLRRLIASPTRPLTILLAKIGGRLAMGWVQMAILIGFGALVLGVNWGRSPGALLLVVIPFSLAAVAFGVLLGTFAKTRSQASGFTTLFAMLFAALGGAFWPLEITPPLYQTVVKALPTTWAMIGFNDVILRGVDAAAVLPEAGILLGFAVLFFALSLPRVRFE